ncbi:MAG: hypothetical protein AAGF11_25385 [Myxococcota bacterium]
MMIASFNPPTQEPPQVFDLIRNESHNRHVFYLDADGHIHPTPEQRFARLQAGYPDAALPQMAAQRVRFAISHVVRLTDPMRLADETFSILSLDANGNIDVPQDYAALQADVDRLEATDYAPLSSPDTPDTPDTPGSLTCWSPDPFTHRRLIAALLGAHYEPWRSWWPHHPQRAA